MRGVYTLYIHVPSETTVTVGALSDRTFPAGTYCYVGSAHGPGGLRARLARHRGDPDSRHWHIDHLTAAAAVVGAQPLLLDAALRVGGVSRDRPDHGHAGRLRRVWLQRLQL